MNFDKELRHRRNRESHEKSCTSKGQVLDATSNQDDCPNDGNSGNGTQHSNFQLNVSDYLLQHRKRRRKDLLSCEKCRKRVTFATENVYINGYLPYKFGFTDAEVITLYRDDIWYNKNDYSSFLKDRVDTIRVYRSVNGNMTGLQDFYSMHGLEHFLQFDETSKLGPRLPANCQENLNTKVMLPTNYSLTCFRDVEFSSQSMEATLDMVQCLDSHEPVKDRISCDSKKSIADVGETILLRSPSNAVCKDRKICEKKSLPVTCSFLSSTPSIRKLFSVDVDSLRKMNMEFLNRMGYNVGPRSQTLPVVAKDSVKNSPPILVSNKPITWQEKEELPNSVLAIASQRNRKSLNTTILAAMDRALEITKNCGDSTFLADQIPAGLESLPLPTNSSE